MKKTRKRHSEKQSSLSIKKIRWLALVFILILVYIFIQGDQGLIKYMQLAREKNRILKRIEELTAESKDLTDEIELLKNNYRHIEKVAREEHRMAKKNEKLYIINPPPEKSNGD
ncbi:septum formation initiator family protein [candidate division KSB1 bacterium]|nr:septum formation initiator family protein [candidate division KSB1 bacterium]